jgi:formylglycine-generating enzyme required for sulfatase activity
MRIPLYPWGEHWAPPDKAGNYGPGLRVDDYDHTSPVGSFAANVNGLYEIGGNVLQWCNDSFSDDTLKVIRGSCWGEQNENHIRSSSRVFGDPLEFYDIIGFRCVLEIAGE